MQPKTPILADEALKIITWCTPSALDWGEHGTAELTRFRVFGRVHYIKEECLELRDRVFAPGLRTDRPKKSADLTAGPPITAPEDF